MDNLDLFIFLNALHLNDLVPSIIYCNGTMIWLDWYTPFRHTDILPFQDTTYFNRLNCFCHPVLLIIDKHYTVMKSRAQSYGTTVKIYTLLMAMPWKLTSMLILIFHGYMSIQMTKQCWWLQFIVFSVQENLLQAETVKTVMCSSNVSGTFHHLGHVRHSEAPGMQDVPQSTSPVLLAPHCCRALPTSFGSRKRHK